MTDIAARHSMHGRPGALRLTLRGWLLIVVVVALLPVLAFTAGRAGATEVPGSHDVVISVEPGDTLWTIARRVAPDADPRDTMADLLQRNPQASSQLRPGTEITFARVGDA